jgi:TPR repeat protein
MVRQVSSALFWSAAHEARIARRPEDALRFFEHLKELPFVPVEALQRTYAAAPLPVERAAPPLETAPPPAAVAGPTEKLPAKADPPAAAASEGEVARVAVTRGRQLLGSGDVIGARRYFELAASRNSAAGATALAVTYDPDFIREAGAPADLADADAARRWYTEAIRRGAPEAKALLERMQTKAPEQRLDPTLMAPSAKRAP